MFILVLLVGKLRFRKEAEEAKQGQNSLDTAPDSIPVIPTLLLDPARRWSHSAGVSAAVPAKRSRPQGCKAGLVLHGAACGSRDRAPFS